LAFVVSPECSFEDGQLEEAPAMVELTLENLLVAEWKVPQSPAEESVVTEEWARPGLLYMV
jgi:hypothetical protein